PSDRLCRDVRQEGGAIGSARRPLCRPQSTGLNDAGTTLNLVQPQPIDTEIVRDIAADMRGELDRVQEQMAELTRENRRAQTLKEIFGLDPLTRDRFNHLHAKDRKSVV